MSRLSWTLLMNMENSTPTSKCSCSSWVRFQAVIIEGTMEVDGVQAVLDIADEHGKLNECLFTRS